MADTRTLTMRFALDNGNQFDINVLNAKEDLTKAQVEAVMQKCLDTQAFIKSGHYVDSIKECYVTTTSKETLE